MLKAIGTFLCNLWDLIRYLLRFVTAQASGLGGDGLEEVGWG